jgi:hypothetical protein
MGGVGAGATLALYPVNEPLRFPALGSTEELGSRIGLLEVVSAEPAKALARLTSSLPGSTLPEVARARIVSAAIDARLRVRQRLDDRELRDRLLVERGWLQVLDPTEPDADVELRKDSRGTILCDAMFGPEHDAVGSLVLFEPGDREGIVTTLEHVSKWYRPLQLARRANQHPGLLEVRLRTGADLSGGDYLPPDISGRYGWELARGTEFVIELANRSSQQLTVGVLNCAMGGTVELLADSLSIPAGTSQIIWQEQTPGQRFIVGIVEGRSEGVDRLVVVGTSLPGVSFQSYQLSQSFREMAKSMVLTTTRAPAVWTARVTSVRMFDPAGSGGD